MGFINNGFIGSAGLDYKWYEEQEVLKDASEFTIVHEIGAGEKIRIYDTKYGEWNEIDNYTRNGQVVTLPVLDENLKFQIYGFGN